MIGNIKYTPDTSIKQAPKQEENPIFLYLEQLRSAFVKNPEILRQLDAIAEKLKKVSDSVLSIISGMIRSQLDSLRASNVSSTAAIMAANAEKYDFPA